MQHSEYSKLVTIAGWAAAGTATLLIITKLVAWFFTDSTSILASLTDSLMDVAASIINLIAIKVALTPADEEHKFGHGKAESLAGLAQAAFISGSACLLILGGFNALIKGHPVQDPGFGIWVMVFSIVVTLLLVAFQTMVVRKTGSVAIKADSLHYKSDIFMNAAVLIALALAAIGFNWADGVFAMGVGGYILYGAWQIGKESVDALMDKRLSPEDEAKVIALAYDNPQVLGVHDLRTRQSGSTKFIQLHLELEDHLSLYDAHEVADKLEAQLDKAFIQADIIIHLDPISVVKPGNRLARA
ncbi:cation diffusion facilitator family transporter [Motilimonas sp. 1_MG-2023]|uniref:cation diffusion facilitator family transporter n=1 Tax=Motilimonas sp. 1_MG-2023 TaxID=3062672 RepID=UPI0026E46CBA|nr:cation diffusion facilitator family transporter [Motilimonas sp. 1_MG-2023]MDO6524797.1 cation diffusion facilitator family transporter [Motilimonas sp. 1_MG-2023]